MILHCTGLIGRLPIVGGCSFDARPSPVLECAGVWCLLLQFMHLSLTPLASSHRRQPCLSKECVCVCVCCIIFINIYFPQHFVATPHFVGQSEEGRQHFGVSFGGLHLVTLNWPAHFSRAGVLWTRQNKCWANVVSPCDVCVLYGG